jgi:hypothetical protein
MPRNKGRRTARKPSLANGRKKVAVQAPARSAPVQLRENGIPSRECVRELSAVIHEPVTLTEEAAEALNDILSNAKAPVGRSTGLRRVVPEGKTT